MNNSTTQAIILKRINFGEADRILTAITPDYGKVSILAKGVRRSKSKLAGGLELFSVTDIGFINGKSNLKTVTSTRLVKHFRKIVENINLTMIAYEFLKLIDTNTQESCDGEYFTVLENGLQSLEEHHENPDVVFVWFADSMLRLMGSNINVESQVDSTKFDEDKMYHFDFDNMGFFEHPAGQYTPKHIKYLRLLSKVSKPENLIQISGSSALAKDLRPLLENCLKIAN